MADIFTNKYM